MNNSSDDYQEYNPIANDMAKFNKQNNRTIWITCGVATAVLLCIALCSSVFLSIVATAFGAMRSSVPYQEAMLAVNRDSTAIETLGNPIEAGWLMSGSIEASDNSGTATFSIPVSGPKGKGTLYVEAQKFEDLWHYDQLYVLVEGHPNPIPLSTENE